MASEHPRYRIRTLDDFLSVPEDRQAACLEEFAAFLLMVRDTQRNSPGFSISAPSFTWTDDNDPGVRSMTLTVESQKPWAALVLMLGLIGVGVLLGLVVSP